MQIFEKAAVSSCIVIECEDELPLRGFDSRISPPRKSQVLFVYHQPHPGKIGFDMLNAAIRGGIVYYYDLKVAECLRR
jgi:hypothetical protein